MTGPEHYREAERLLDQATNPPSWADPDRLVSAAQVHATLALAAPVLDELDRLRAELARVAHDNCGCVSVTP